MNVSRKAALAGAALMVFGHLGSDAAETDPIIDSINQFGHKALVSLSAGDPATVLLSPLSIATLAGLISSGDPERSAAVAARFGLTDEAEAQLGERFKGLHDQLAPGEGVTLKAANGLWADPQFTIQDEFRNEVVGAFEATIETLPFDAPETVKAINDWVTEQTEGMITEIVGELPAAGVVAANALFFHGGWRMPFDAAWTRPEPFTAASGDSRAVPMMHLASKRLNYAENDAAQFVELPFGTGDYGLLIALPKPTEGEPGGLSQWLADEAGGWTAIPDLELRLGSVAVPKLSIANGYDLTALLADLDLNLTGSYPAIADPDPILGAVVHKAAFEMDEKGATAAAVTAAILEMALQPEDEFTLTVDRPFAFAIRHAPTGLMLFMGAVFDVPDQTGQP